MTTTPAEHDAMRRALGLAATPGVPHGPNPRVGCVLLGADGAIIAEGYHRGAGTPHAEADALAQAGERARGATAVVTLEPCAHTGRTGPCAVALREAGVSRVVFAQSDPNPIASGGAALLRSAGIEVEAGLLVEEARALNRAWTFALERGRPLVTWKLAATLDGRIAAADGSSRWISGRAARRDAHRLRVECDAIMVGTNTAVVDNPQLTARDADDQPLPAQHQPLRVVMGERELPASLRVFDGSAETVRLRTRDVETAVKTLESLDRRHVLLEGGPTLAAAFLRAGLVDEIIAYVTPMVLGAGLSAVADFGVATIAGALRPVVTDVTVLEGLDGEEPCVRLTMDVPGSDANGGK